MTHEEKTALRDHLYKHGIALMDKIQKMFNAGGLTEEQMSFAADVMKDIASMDKSLSKACYYDSQRGTSADKTY